MSKLSRYFAILFSLAFLSAVLPSAARAQDDDPPGRVARLNYMQGSVSYQVQGETDWVAADPNRPLTTGDNLWVDEDSRGEVHVESTAIRLASDTGISFLNLDDRTVQLQLAQGTIEVHVRQMEPGDAFEIDTPNLAFTLTRAGEYMISTDANGGSTRIIVREGAGEVTGGGDSWDIGPDRTYYFNGTDQLSYEAQPAGGFNDFEAWCQERDQRENNAVAARYVSRDVDGYYDLDDYGDWSQDSDYGAVWYPRAVAVDWVPYHTGHWVYIAPWGWTWVDAEPWGFAPFHYGRWVLVGARWGWVPGPIVRRPVYAPALVGFVGGSGFGISVTIGRGFNGVAWFPLGPRDVFVPAYHCSPHYVQVVNVTNTRVVNVTQVTNVYNTVVINRDVTHVNYTYNNNVRAITAVRHDTFVNARPVAKEAVQIHDDDIRNVKVVSNVAVAPTRSSYVFSEAKVSNAKPAVPFSQRPVVANLPPRAPAQAQQNPHNNVRINNGFRGFGQQNGNNGNAPNAPQGNNGNANSGSNSGPRVFNPPAQGRQAPPMMQSGTNSPNNAAPNPPNNGNGQNRPVRTLEEQGTSNNAQPAQPQNPPNNGPNNNRPGFRPFGQQGNNGNGGNNNGGTTYNHTPPQPVQNGNPSDSRNINQNQNQNQERGNWRFSPPVKADDKNYDVHPPLNQNQPNNQPRQEAQPRPQQNQTQPRQDNRNDSAPRDNKDNKSDDKKKN